MKKTVGVFAFLTLTLISFASAGPVEGVRQLLDGLRHIIRLLIWFFFDISAEFGIYNQYFFAKIILLFLIYIVVYTAIKTTIFKSYVEEGKAKPVLYIIAASVSILSIRFLPNEYIAAILLPYSALAVGITVSLPLMIFFFFLHNSGMGTFGRETGWVIFGAAFIALWSSMYDQLGSANWIYWLGLAFVIVCFIFDRRIHNYFGYQEYKKARKDYLAELYAEYEAKIKEIDNKLKDQNLPDSVKRSLKRTREKHFREQARLMKKIN
jgi:hypothetical protein